MLILVIHILNLQEADTSQLQTIDTDQALTDLSQYKTTSSEITPFNRLNTCPDWGVVIWAKV